MGNSPECFFLLNRSCSAAATNWPSMTSAAAASIPWAMRYSRSSRPGHVARLKGTEFSNPLIPMIFIAFHSKRNREAARQPVGIRGKVLALTFSNSSSICGE